MQHGHPLHCVTEGITLLYYLHSTHANLESADVCVCRTTGGSVGLASSHSCTGWFVMAEDDPGE